MEIKNWTQPIDRSAYVGVVSGVKNAKEGSAQPVHNADTVVISEEARRAAMAAEMEQGGISPRTAEKLVPGKFTVAEPDWDTFEVPMLQGQADRKIYQTAYLESYLKELGAITDQIQSYYTPEFSKIESKSTADALAYLFKTYKQPWMKDVFLAGTNIPLPPNGMSEEEANMAYDQLAGMHFGKGAPVLRDPYALGSDGIERLDNVEKHAHEAAQKVYDAAQKEYEAEQETWKVEQKERHKRMYQSLNSGNSTCLGYMALRPETEDELAD